MAFYFLNGYFYLAVAREEKALFAQKIQID